MASMKDYFYRFIEERVEDIAVCVVLKNTRYKDLSKEVARFKQGILAGLPEESKHILLNYESTEGLLEAVVREEIYRAAFLDGVRVSHVFNRVNRRRFK